MESLGNMGLPPYLLVVMSKFFGHATAFYAIICCNDIKYTRTFCKIQSFTKTHICSSHAVRDLGPTMAAVHDFCQFRGVPKVQPSEDTQTMTLARSTISLVVRVISRSKNNFYDVIRLKIIESQYFPKETVKVGLEKIKQNGGQLKATKCRWISSVEISKLDIDRDFSR